MCLFLKDFKRYLIISMCFLTVSSPQAGFAAPDVWLEGIDGTRHNLNEYIGKGKWTALNLWGARCPPCLEEMPELIHFHDTHKDSKAIVVGVAIDFPSYGYAKKDEVAAFIDDHLIEFPVLLSDASISEKIGVGILEGLPTTYLYTPQGKLVAMQVGGITRSLLEAFIDKYNNRTDSKSGPSNKKNE